MYIHLLNDPKDGARNNFKLKADSHVHYLLEEDSKLDVKADEKSFEIIDAELAIKPNTFVVFNNVPITEEGRGIFEERFTNRPRKIENEPGFSAYRLCRPLNSDTYVIMSFWNMEADYENWRKSEAYKYTHKKRGTSEGIDQQHGDIFAGPAFVETYTLT